MGRVRDRPRARSVMAGSCGPVLRGSVVLVATAFGEGTPPPGRFTGRLQIAERPALSREIGRAWDSRGPAPSTHLTHSGRTEPAVARLDRRQASRASGCLGPASCSCIVLYKIGGAPSPRRFPRSESDPDGLPTTAAGRTRIGRIPRRSWCPLTSPRSQHTVRNVIVRTNDTTTPRLPSLVSGGPLRPPGGSPAVGAYAVYACTSRGVPAGTAGWLGPKDLSGTVRRPVRSMGAAWHTGAHAGRAGRRAVRLRSGKALRLNRVSSTRYDPLPGAGPAQFASLRACSGGLPCASMRLFPAGVAGGTTRTVACGTWQLARSGTLGR